MTCAACVARVERVLSRHPGVASASVNLMAGTAVVQTTDPTTTQAASLAEAVTRIGYATRPHEGRRDQPAEADTHLGAATGSLTIFALSMVIGTPLMTGSGSPFLMRLAMPFHDVVHHLLPVLWQVPATVLGWMLLLLHIPVAAFWMRPFLVAAWKAARSGTADMNTLVATGTLSAFALSIPSVLVPQWLAAQGLPAPMWFESVSGVLGFVALGKYLEGKAKRSSGRHLQDLASLIPQQARLLEEGAEVVVPTTGLVPGQRIRVLPGERVPADGRLDQETALLDTSHFTGEPLPREVSRGDEVPSGSLVVSHPVVLSVERSGAGSTIERIVQLVEQAQSSKAPLQRTADRIAEIFAPAVLGIALATLLLWGFFGPSWVFAVTAAISVLVAACPCAMGLAVPSALTVAVGRAAKMGILVRDATVLETLGRATTVVFDKTGTLTLGRPRLVEIRTAPGRTPEEVLRLAATAESDSTHPLAAAVMETYREQIPLAPLARSLGPSTTLPGQGVKVMLPEGELRVGRAEWVCDHGTLPTAHPGETLVHVGLEGGWLGALAFQDPPRPESARVVAQLRSRGIQVELLSGDGPEAVEATATALGILRHVARATPESKAAHVKALRDRGEVVVMVGDGINDSAALAASDAGLALEAGTAVAFESAQAVIRHPDQVPSAVDLGRATVRTVYGNLGWAFGYNTLLIPVAAGVFHPFLGWQLSPVLAGAAMSLSSVSVMLHSLRLLRFRPTSRKESP